MTREEFRDKIDWQGGVLEALEYGLKPEDCDDIELAGLWRSARERYTHLDMAVEAILTALGPR